MITERQPGSRVGNLRGVAVAYLVGMTISGALVTTLGMRFPEVPTGATPDLTLALSAAASFIMAASLCPLAKGLRGSLLRRWLILAEFTYVLSAVTTQIDAALLTDFGGTATMLMFSLLPCLLAAGAAAILVPPVATGTACMTATERGRAWPSWWKATLVWLAYPCVTFVFGIVFFVATGDLFRRELTGIETPEPVVMLAASLVRGLLVVAVTLPIVRDWSRSRRGLTLSLGTALFVLSGLFGLVQATWWPLSVRVAQAGLILATSVAYAWIFVAILAPRSRCDARTPSPEPPGRALGGDVCFAMAVREDYIWSGMSDTADCGEETRPFRVGDWLVEPSLNRLVRGDTVVRLDLKAMELLVFLAQHQGELLSKRRLVDAVWKIDVIADGTLTHAIAQLRKSLGDNARSPAFIETIPKRGYRLIAPVRPTDVATPLISRARSRFRLAAHDREFALAEGDNLIGRERTAAVRIDCPGVSRRHARIVIEEDSAVLEDLGSKNGTFVAGRRLVQPARLAHGDEIRLGQAVARFTFVVNDSHQTRQD